MDISRIISDGYVDRYANLAGCTLLLYDYLVTLDDERKPWSIGKVLFIISRYDSLIITVAVNNHAFFGGLSGSGCLTIWTCKAFNSLTGMVGSPEIENREEEN
ncbi:hypothetical protein EV368DRAFT_69120 [Lentinula lateritia]|nr:hypothetical protein EV368DRAFT_69120 [Lentinula lateritia]